MLRQSSFWDNSYKKAAGSALMKRGAAEKIGVFMNASVNVQVNVVHSPSAVVRGDYESDLANCLNPSNSTDLDPTSQ